MIKVGVTSLIEKPQLACTIRKTHDLERKKTRTLLIPTRPTAGYLQAAYCSVTAVKSECHHNRSAKANDVLNRLNDSFCTKLSDSWSVLNTFNKDSGRLFANSQSVAIM